MLHAKSAGVTLAVRAQPGAKRTAITGIYGEGAAAQLKIAVNAPPFEGRANAALVAFLAEILTCRRVGWNCYRARFRGARCFCCEG